MEATISPDSKAINNESLGNKTPEDVTCSARWGSGEQVERAHGPAGLSGLGSLGSRTHTAGCCLDSSHPVGWQ